MSHETFSETYYGHRIRLAQQIEATARTYVEAIVGDRGFAETRVSNGDSEVKFTLRGMLESIGVTYQTPALDTEPARFHRFMFGYGGALRYKTQNIGPYVKPSELYSIEDIAKNERALGQLAWMSTAIVSSPLAEKIDPYQL